MTYNGRKWYPKRRKAGYFFRQIGNLMSQATPELNSAQ